MNLFLKYMHVQDKVPCPEPEGICLWLQAAGNHWFVLLGVTLILNIAAQAHKTCNMHLLNQAKCDRSENTSTYKTKTLLLNELLFEKPARRQHIYSP